MIRALQLCPIKSPRPSASKKSADRSRRRARDQEVQEGTDRMAAFLRGEPRRSGNLRPCAATTLGVGEASASRGGILLVSRKGPSRSCPIGHLRGGPRPYRTGPDPVATGRTHPSRLQAPPRSRCCVPSPTQGVGAVLRRIARGPTCHRRGWSGQPSKRIRPTFHCQDRRARQRGLRVLTRRGRTTRGPDLNPR